jgi:hypothetical protein
MKSLSNKFKFIFVVLFSLQLSLFAQSVSKDKISKLLTEYFVYLQKADSPLDVGVIKQNKMYWLKNSNSISFNRFFYFHKPIKWNIKEINTVGNYASATVEFETKSLVKNATGYFEVILKNGDWKIVEFKDYSRKTDKDIPAEGSLKGYLKLAFEALEKLDSPTKQAKLIRMKRYILDGAGFWKEKFGAYKSKLFFHFLLKNKPSKWKITKTETGEKDTTVTVTFLEPKSEIVFDMFKDDGLWYIKDYYDKNLKSKMQKLKKEGEISASKIDNATIQQNSPEDVVKTQLELLQNVTSMQPTVISKLMEKSKKLWINPTSRKTKSTLGRLIGIFYTFKLKGGYDIQTSDNIVTISFKNSNKMILFQKLIFEVAKDKNLYKIKNITMKR